MGTTTDGLAALGLIVGAAAIALAIVIVRLVKGGRAVPAPWEFPNPFRRAR